MTDHDQADNLQTQIYESLGLPRWIAEVLAKEGPGLRKTGGDQLKLSWVDDAGAEIVAVMVPSDDDPEAWTTDATKRKVASQ